MTSITFYGGVKDIGGNKFLVEEENCNPTAGTARALYQNIIRFDYKTVKVFSK